MSMDDKIPLYPENNTGIPTDEDMFKLSRGLLVYLRRLLTQVSLVCGIPEILRDYISVLDIASVSDFKNLKLLREFILALESLGIVEQKGDTFKWIGGEVRKTEDEQYIEKLSVSWAMLVQWYSKRFLELLKGQPPIDFHEVAVWDSLFSSKLYHNIWAKALDLLSIDETSTVLEIGCKTGWSTLNILKNYNPKHVIAIDSNERFVQIAEDNIKTFIPEKLDNVSFVYHDFLNEFEISNYYEGELPSKIVVSLLFHWYSPDQYLPLLTNIRKTISEDAEIIFIQPHLGYKNQSKYFEIFFFSEKRFKGYPLLEDLVRMFAASGFSVPTREFNLFILSKASDVINDEFTFSPDPPKFCINCGKILQKNTFYCAYCRAVNVASINFPIL
ncbi:MAG: class I SAM-dependent methyltransferase [Candidatus Odinarchaeia archaeon]